MSEDSLKKCPFCNERVLVYMDDSDDGCRTYYGTCNICDMRTEDFKKEQELLEYLNTRPIEDALNQRIRELEQWQREAVKFLPLVKDDFEVAMNQRKVFLKAVGVTIQEDQEYFEYAEDFAHVTNLIKQAEGE